MGGWSATDASLPVTKDAERSGALTVSPALQLPGDYSLPSGSRRGTDQLAVTFFPLCAKRGAERPRVCGFRASARKEQSRSGAAISGVRRGALCPGGRNQAF